MFMNDLPNGWEKATLLPSLPCRLLQFFLVPLLQKNSKIMMALICQNHLEKVSFRSQPYHEMDIKLEYDHSNSHRGVLKYLFPKDYFFMMQVEIQGNN